MKDLRFGKRIINKRSIKRFVSYVMMASMVLGLTACGSGNGNVGAVDDGKLQVVTTIFPEYSEDFHLRYFYLCWWRIRCLGR